MVKNTLEDTVKLGLFPVAGRLSHFLEAWRGICQQLDPGNHTAYMPTRLSSSRFSSSFRDTSSCPERETRLHCGQRPGPTQGNNRGGSCRQLGWVSGGGGGDGEGRVWGGGGFCSQYVLATKKTGGFHPHH